MALGKADADAWTTRLRQALRDARARAEAIGGSVPGTLTLAQGLLLQELGETREAQSQLRDTLRAPERLLSHHLARQAMSGAASR